VSVALQLSGKAQDVAINLDRGCLLRGGCEIRLRAKTFQVLKCLHERHGLLVTKEDLFRAVWPDTFVSDDSLTKCIREIRHALNDADRQLVKTVARRGFILDAPLTTVRIAGVEARTPPLRESSEPRIDNLPAQLTSFIGREREMAELERLLASTRLLTLTGAGGCGKTRLALEVARQVLDRFPDGVWLADLAPLGEPSRVAHVVASVVDIRQAPGRSLVESMLDQLRHRRTLLLLDNCEHVIGSASELAETLLRGAAGLTILATSREALGIAGETTWRVPSLGTPDPGHPTPSDHLLEYGAVRLLVERATAAGSTFALTQDNAGTVAEVCRRLDGIPLAIELAAARLKVLSIEQVNARLDDRFRLLTGTGRGIGRQRTLEATVDWSYDLLPEGERLLLRRLSTFAGGWTLEAAEHVCAGDGIDGHAVLDLMTRLVDKSLVIVDADPDGLARYRCLETVRHYGRQRLQESGEAPAVRARHFAFFLHLARRAEPELTRAKQLLWLDRLQMEHDNLGAALEWCLVSRRPGSDGLELAAALHWFWLKSACFAEGQQWLERALASDTGAVSTCRARAIMALGSIVFFQGDFARADGLLGESAVLAGAAGELATVALARGLQTMGAMERGDRAAAAQCAAQSAAAGRASGEPWLESFSLTYRAYEALYAGDLDRAGDLHEKVLAMGRAQGDVWGIGIVLCDLALLRVVQHHHAEARALCGEGITLARQFGDRRAIAWCLGVLAGADAAEGQPLRAARLLGAMEGLLDAVGSSAQPTYNALIGDRLAGALQEQLGTDTYGQALAAGRAMSLSQAMDWAVDAQAAVRSA
jgi:non-specific serine/threonine protein kinase